MVLVKLNVKRNLLEHKFASYCYSLLWPLRKEIFQPTHSNKQKVAQLPTKQADKACELRVGTQHPRRHTRYPHLQLNRVTSKICAANSTEIYGLTTATRETDLEKNVQSGKRAILYSENFRGWLD